MKLLTSLNFSANLALFSILIFCKEVQPAPGNDPTLAWWKIVSTSYPKYENTTKLLHSMEETYPTLVKIYSMGKSVQKREMWVVNIRSKMDSPKALLIPSLKIVANMHGDEAVGRALALMLAVNLLQRYNSGDERVTKLLDATDIHLVPSVNPDGFELSKEGDCDPYNRQPGRRNVNDFDLNRNFPDQFLEKTKAEIASITCHGQPETKNIMKFITENDFVVSVNLHGGAVVAIYPFDSVPLSVAASPGYENSGIESISPDNDVFKFLAKSWADKHKTMSDQSYSRTTENCVNDSFPGGFINGANWYNVRGGMQDFNYVHSNCFEITVELSCCKYPKAEELLKEWDDAVESLFGFLESAHMGIKGVVKNSKGEGLEGEVIVEGREHHVKTTKRGEYWRLLLPGKYKIGARAPGYAPSEFVEVDVDQLSVGNAKVLDFTLTPGGDGSVSSKVPFFIPTDCSKYPAPPIERFRPIPTDNGTATGDRR